MAWDLKDPDGMLGTSNSAMDGSSGYDTNELKSAHESLSGHQGDEKGYEKVEPIFIQVSDGKVARESEFEARSVIIEYDEYDNVVSVELL